MADHIRAMTEMHSLEWSPDGWSIAFMGAMDGSSSDLYVYSFRTEELLRLTDGPTQGYAPHWSPDGQWIVHFGADTFGTGAGATVTGAWAARADGSEIRTLYNPNSGGEFFVGWVNDSTFMVYTWNVECGARELRTVDINTNAVSMVWESWFTDAAVGSGQTLVSAKGLEGCGVTSGLYLNGAQISATGTDRVVWSAHNGIFFAGSYEGTAYSVSVRGEVMPLETMYIPVVSADAEKWAGITLDGVLYAGFIQPGNTPAAIAPNARSVVYVG
jgi:WD40 repeat protein